MIHEFEKFFLAVKLYASIQEALLSNSARKSAILADFHDY